MRITVRLPHRVEQALTNYCVETHRTKSEVIVELLEQRFLMMASETVPYDLAEAVCFIGCVEGEINSAANAKKLVRDLIRGKHSR